jgi:hypothetical protein
MLVGGGEQRIGRPLDENLESLFTIANEECNKVVNRVARGIRLGSSCIDDNDEDQSFG